MLTRDDLIGLGIQPGSIFAKIFKAVKDSSSKEDALVIAKAIQAGTFVPERKESVVFVKGSVWWWLKKHPSMQDLSGSELRRMISEGAVRLNWRNDWNPDALLGEITELTLFPSGKRRTLLWCSSCGSECKHAAELMEDVARQRVEEEEKRQRKNSEAIA